VEDQIFCLAQNCAIPHNIPDNQLYVPHNLPPKSRTILTFSTPYQKSCLVDISPDWTKEDVEETLAKAVNMYKKQEK